MTKFDTSRLYRLHDTMAQHVDDDHVGGVAWLAACGGDVHAGCAGSLTRGQAQPIRRDSAFRIASMTKPIVAAAALLLVEDCVLRLEDPIDDWLPELAARQVLVDGRGPIDGPSVPAHRSITLHDVLTFRLGLGMDFAAPWPQPLLEAMAQLGLGAGPPEPLGLPAPDKWMAGLAALPLLYQPGERWLYNTGSDVLGVLVSRAAGQPLADFLHRRLFEPLGMTNTGFFTANVERLGTCYSIDPMSGARVVYDPPDGQWSVPPTFASGAAGLVSTIDDMYAFGRLLLRSGRLPDGSRLLSRAAVAAMTSDQIGADRGVLGPSLDASRGWGFGVGVTVRRTGLGPAVGSYGWDGGLGSSWLNDPSAGLVGVICTTDAFVGPSPPPAVIQDFWTTVHAAIDD